MALRLIFACCAVGVTAQGPSSSPADVMTRVLGAFVSRPPSHMFWRYDYGSATMLCATYEAARVFDDVEWAVAAMDRHLASFLDNATSEASSILSNVTIPFGISVGDHVGLMGAAWLSRAQYYGLPVDAPEWTVALRTADQYILRWPLRLDDGSGIFSRAEGWAAQPPGTAFMWLDDSYMGTTLLARLAAAGAPNAATYLDLAANATLAFAGFMQDAAGSGLYSHGYNHATRTRSCCAWGRANGWVAAHFIELLSALPTSHRHYAAVLAAFQSHAAALIATQSPDGRWHQVLDNSTTFLETSASAFALFALARGASGGWLAAGPGTPVDVAVRRAWPALAARVAADGTVELICSGTSIMADAEGYNTRPTDYEVSSPGLGHVIRAITAYAEYIAVAGSSSAVAT